VLKKHLPFLSGLDFDDDDEWHRMQEGVDKIEKVLDTKSKTSHDVHAPFFPEVQYGIVLGVKHSPPPPPPTNTPGFLSIVLGRVIALRALAVDTLCYQH
jgi:hypothetical protein